MKNIIKHAKDKEVLKGFLDGFGKFDIWAMALHVTTVFDDGREDTFIKNMAFHRNAGSHVTEVVYYPGMPWEEKFYCTTFDEFEKKLTKMLCWN